MTIPENWATIDEINSSNPSPPVVLTQNYAPKIISSASNPVKKKKFEPENEADSDSDSSWSVCSRSDCNCSPSGSSSSSSNSSSSSSDSEGENDSTSSRKFNKSRFIVESRSAVVVNTNLVKHSNGLNHGLFSQTEASCLSNAKSKHSTNPKKLVNNSASSSVSKQNFATRKFFKRKHQNSSTVRSLKNDFLWPL